MGRAQWIARSRLRRTRAWVPCSRDSVRMCYARWAERLCWLATTRSSASLALERQFSIVGVWVVHEMFVVPVTAASFDTLTNGKTRNCKISKTSLYVQDSLHF